MARRKALFPTRSFSGSLKEHMDVYEIFRSYVRHEDNLINNRMTWMLSIHGFLYASYGLTIQKKMEVYEKIQTGYLTRGDTSPNAFENYLRTGDLWFAILQGDVFIVLISLVGIVISFYAFISIRAAKLSIKSIEEIFHMNYRQTFLEKQVVVGEATPSVGRSANMRTDTTIYYEQTNDEVLKQHDVRIIELGSGDEHKKIAVPAIAGGGAKHSSKAGFSASMTVPLVLSAGWLFAIYFAFIYHSQINRIIWDKALENFAFFRF